MQHRSKQDMDKVCLVSVVDVVSTTSIPINEFIIYRNKIRNYYRQIVFTRTPENRGNVKMPEGITVYNIPSSRGAFRKQIKELLSESKSKGEQVIFHMHHQKSAMMFFAATFFLGIRRNTLFTIHSFYSDRDTKYKISSCLCALWANYTNCVSLAAYKDYPAWVRAIKGRRMGAILNGIDCERIDRALSNEKRPDDFYEMKRLVCIDRIIPIKNQKFIIGLLKSLPETKLILVGMEDKNQEIRKLAEYEGVIDRVEFTGLLPREDVYRTIYKCGLYVTASIVEGLLLRVLEAMRVGAIPLISDIPAHREIASNCERLFEPLPLVAETWISNIKKFQNTNKNDLTLFSERLSKVTEINFSLDKMHEEYDKVYNNILREC